MRVFAIIGQSASGKSDLAHTIAHAANAVLFSMDSLSVYKNIDIASAKPAAIERADLVYFGLDIIDPNDRFSVMDFVSEYQKAIELCERSNRNLIIVGGSAFYLKCLTSGLSKIPKISSEISAKVAEMLNDIGMAYKKLCEIDPIYAQTIKSNDRYRIEKALLIALESGEKPSNWFRKYPPEPFIDNIAIAIVQRDINELRERIKIRTRNMIEIGLINEVENLLKTTTANAQPLKAIGIKETIEYIMGNITIVELENLINIHTSQFAKRQKTYINSQFARLIKPPLDEFAAIAVKYLTFK